MATGTDCNGNSVSTGDTVVFACSADDDNAHCGRVMKVMATRAVATQRRTTRVFVDTASTCCDGVVVDRDTQKVSRF